MVAVVAAALSAVTLTVFPPAVAAAGPTASLSLAKNVFEAGTSTPLTSPVQPGQSFDYQLSSACSGLTEGCINAKTVDVIPPDIDIIVPPSLPPLYTVAYDAPTRTLTVTYTDVLASPPNPSGSIGMPAGSTRQVTVHATLSAATTAPDGSTITNTATATADNATSATDSALITVTVPRTVTPIASKTMSPDTVIALSGASVTATLGVHNGSSSAAEITSLAVADLSKQIWDDFDLAGIGPVTSFPAGANEVSVRACTLPAPCTESQLMAGPFVTGPDLSLPAGVNAGDVTGIEFVFRDSSGAVLPVSATEGVVPISLTLRDTVRSTGAPLNPTSALSQANCARPAAVDAVDGRVAGTDACVSFSVLPGTASVAVSKSFFPDAKGNFTNNGYAVGGQSSPVSAIVNAKNTSAFAIANLTITEPSASAPNDFADVDVTSIKLVFPAGATAASGSVTCRDATVVPISATADTTITLPAGCIAASVTVTYTGAIAVGATAKLGVHGTLNNGAAPNTTIKNCADGSTTDHGAASGTGCANLKVEPPRTSVGGSKTSSNAATGGALVRNQNMTFSLHATNNGNLPQSSFVLTDPAPGGDNPFTFMTLTSATLTTSPASLASRFVIEVLHGATWVTYSGVGDPLAQGIRARLTSGVVLPTQSVTLTFTGKVSTFVPNGTTLHNCQQTDVASTVGTAQDVSCAATLTAEPARTGGAVNKIITPATAVHAIPGVPPQSAQIRLQVENTGNGPMQKIVLTDPDPAQDNPAAFFDAVDFAGFDGVNLPPGADRIQVDACTSAAACQAGTYVLGTPAATATLPAGVAPGTVTGLRFTFTASSAGPSDYLLIPGGNFPASGPCPSATVCFRVTPRLTLRSNPAVSVPVPDSLTNVVAGAAVSPLSPGTLAAIGEAPAPLVIVKGTVELGTKKTALPTDVSPGTSIGYTLATTNTGTDVVPGLVVTEPIPAGLVFDQTFAGDNGLPYKMSFSVPPGTPTPPQPTFTPVLDPATHQVTSLTWQFPNSFVLLPGSSISFQIQANLAPGTAAGTKVTNTYGASTSDTDARPSLTCKGGTPPDEKLGCAASAVVTALSGSDIDAQKWIHGDDSRGFFNTRTNAFVPIGDPSCPLITAGGKNYTRFPCVALVLAGQNFEFLLNLTNVGTTPATQSRLVDDLPKVGDNGVIVPSGRGTEWDPRPRLAAPPALVAGAPGSLSSLAYAATSPGCIAEISKPPAACPSGAWQAAFSPNAAAFRTFIDFSPALPPGQSTQLTVQMSAPADLDTTSNPMPIAWNSFAHSDFFQQSNNSIIQLAPVEPIKVGIAMPFGNLRIDKTVTGPIPNSSLIGPFHVTYSCVVTTATGNKVTVASGAGEFNHGMPLTVVHVPAGAVCTVHETDAGGGIPTEPKPVTITGGTTPGIAAPTAAEVVNDFPAPRLIVTKALAGDAAALVPGPFDLEVDCRIRGAAVPGYPRPLTFDGAGSQSITDLPIGATCTVSEPDNRGATSTSVSYSDGDHATISATADAVASVTNTYDPAALTVTKKVTGQGPAGPYRFSASCRLVGSTGASATLPLAAADASFSLSNGQHHEITVPKNARCLVQEIRVPAGDHVTYDGTAEAPEVTVDGTVTLSVVNAFGEVAPATGGRSPGPGDLAATGTDIVLPIQAGLLLILCGGVLLLTGHRAPRRRRAQ